MTTPIFPLFLLSSQDRQRHLRAPGPFRVYPFESRLRWLFSSRYHHILSALELAPNRAHDSLLQERARALRHWDRIRGSVLLLLYFGFVGTAVGYAGNFLPFLQKTTAFLASIIHLLGALTGLLTLAYLFLTRLLSQIEADILMLLALNG